jgi:hypothetical protein
VYTIFCNIDVFDGIKLSCIKGRKNLEIVEMKPNLKNLNNIHREKSGKRTGNTSTV